jgi:hypothetical protein
MSKLRFTISMSLDGFVAGPNQSVDNPLGIGGRRLHEWAFPLRAFKVTKDRNPNEKLPSTRTRDSTPAPYRRPRRSSQ